MRPAWPGKSLAASSRAQEIQHRRLRQHTLGRGVEGCPRPLLLAGEIMFEIAAEPAGLGYELPADADASPLVGA